MTHCSSVDLPTLFQTILHFVLHKINDCFLQERKQQDVFVKLSIKHKGSVLHPDIHYRPRSYLWNTSMQEFSSCSPNTEKVPIIIWWNTEHYCIKHENECFMGYPNTKKHLILIWCLDTWIYQTREAVCQLLSKPTVPIQIFLKSNTGWGGSFNIQAPRSKIFKTRISVSFDIQSPSFIQSNTRRSVSFDIQHRKVM